MQAQAKFNLRKSKRYLFGLLFATMLLIITWRSPAVASTAKHYTELDFPPLPEIQLPEYTRYQLDNGITVYLMEDRELPLIGGTALFHTGSRYEPADKVGLASLTGEVMRTGGTVDHTADELNQILEQKAAAVETGIGTTAGSAGFSALSEDLEEVFGLFAEVVQKPVFDAQKLELAKNQQKGGIARRNDSPERIAGREFQKLIYGKDSPYARTVEYQTLNNIQREDLVEFYQKYFHPENMILGISGDFETDKMKALIAEKFGNWKPAKMGEIPPEPNTTQAHQGGIYFINQPQLTQSYIEMGHIGGERNNPDYPELMVLNGVLNGFGGRLFNQIRTNQGLAYTVYGIWNANYDYPGVFIAGGQTRSDATVDFLKAVQTELSRVQREPVKPEELSYAKESTLNSFIFNFESPDQTLSRLMLYEFYDYPQDFIFDYQRQVEATTVEDIQRVAQKYLKLNKIVTLVVGNEAEIQPPLSTLDSETKITAIDISIPEPS
ncbi:pitrilysin family protein [Lyngbya sp. PCC 8106]|uniref:M16 family metallopeptidase n=1 Tax=Lyngbya sp. (strain PCC 8106) TaxID=313612 RepID=UPI000586E97C|nr:pitrilysin family protein [Lyngbya sp. PCC 8106]